MKANSNKRMVIPVLLGLVIPAASLMVPGCKKDEPPPPLPSAAPESTEQATLTLEPEDAGVDADADAAKKATGPYKPASSLKACCAALQQNSKSAPPPQNAYMSQAAAICYSMVATGQGSGTVLGAIRGALKGAGMPSACQ